MLTIRTTASHEVPPPRGEDRLAAAALGEAEFSAVVAVAAWPAAGVRLMVPREVTLEPPAGWSAAQHPLVVLFGTQASGATRLAGLRIPVGRSYQEFVLVVPSLRSTGVPEPAAAIVRAYANYFPAVWNGRRRYGFGKEEAEIHAGDASFVVTRPSGRPVCTAVHEPREAWSDACPRDLTTVAGWLSGTLIGATETGRRVRSISRWNVSGCATRAVRVALWAMEALVPGCGPGELLGDLRSAFEVRAVRWSLGWPE